MRKFVKLVVIVLLGFICFAQSMPDYRNPKLPIPDRVADLLKRMTLEEKVDQLAGGNPIAGLAGDGQFEAIAVCPFDAG